MATQLGPAPGSNSNASRPLPRANTGSALLDWISDTSIALLLLERRFDPFVRPVFDEWRREVRSRRIGQACGFAAACGALVARIRSSYAAM